MAQKKRKHKRPPQPIRVPIQLYDLSDLPLPDDASPLYCKAWGLCEKFRSAVSIARDLAEAKEYIDLCKEIITTAATAQFPEHWDKNPKDALIAGGLQKASLMAYFRAVDPQGLGRKPGPVTNGLITDELKAAHARLLIQRHNSIAHYGPRQTNSVHWATEKLGVMLDPSTHQARLFTPWVRYRCSIDLLNDLLLTLTALIPFWDERKAKIRNDLKDALKAMAQNGQLSSLLSIHFDHPEFYSSVGGAEGLRRSANTKVGDWFDVSPLPS